MLTLILSERIVQIYLIYSVVKIHIYVRFQNSFGSRANLCIKEFVYFLSRASYRPGLWRYFFKLYYTPSLCALFRQCAPIVPAMFPHDQVHRPRMLTYVYLPSLSAINSRRRESQSIEHHAHFRFSHAISPSLKRARIILTRSLKLCSLVRADCDKERGRPLGTFLPTGIVFSDSINSLSAALLYA